MSLLDGLASAGGWDIGVTVASVEDAHHTWEGIFRGVGIALAKTMREPRRLGAGPDGDRAEVPAASSNGADAEPLAPPLPAEAPVERGWRVLGASPSAARLRRDTAESHVGVEIALGEPERAAGSPSPPQSP